MSKASLTYSSGVALTNTTPKMNISAVILDGSTFATASPRAIIAIWSSLSPIWSLKNVRGSPVVCPALMRAPDKMMPARPDRTAILMLIGDIETRQRDSQAERHCAGLQRFRLYLLWHQRCQTLFCE